MPRPKIINRKRVLKACTSCKRRKEKCDGIQPCGRCKHRSRGRECSFLEDTPGTGTQNASSLANHSSEDLLERGCSSLSAEPHQDISRPHNPDSDVSASHAATSAPVPELPVRTPQDTLLLFRLFYKTSSFSARDNTGGRNSGAFKKNAQPQSFGYPCDSNMFPARCMLSIPVADLVE